MARVDDDRGAVVAVEGMSDAAGSSVVKLIGEIDISNADAVAARIDRIIGDGTDCLVVDLSALEFMDSCGIAVLIRAASRVTTFEIRNPSTVVRRIIECTGLGDVLRTDP